MYYIYNMQQLVIVNSRNRVYGTKHDFYVNIADGLVRASNTEEVIQVTVVDAVINRSWYSVQDNNNTYRVENVQTGASTTFHLPVGYYNVNTLQAALKAHLVGWTITYDRQTNKYTFQSPNDAQTYRFVFEESQTSLLFGFDVADRPVVRSDQPLTSTYPVRVNAETCVLIHSDVPKLKASTIDNIASKTFAHSDVLCVIPISAAPFDNVVYSNANDNYTFHLSSKALNMVRFYLTDEFNRPILLPHDWMLTLKVTYVQKDDAVKDTLARIADYVKYAVLSQEK